MMDCSTRRSETTVDLHFGLGESFCETLAQIAREKILYDYDMDGACRVFEDSLGCDRQVAKDLISGKDWCLYVPDDNNTTVMMCDRPSLPEGKEYSQFNVDKHVRLWLDTIQSEADRMTRDMSHMLSLLYCPSRKAFITIVGEIPVEQLISAFVENHPEDLKETLYKKMKEAMESGLGGGGDKNFLRVKNLINLVKIATEWIRDSSEKVRIIKEMHAAGFLITDKTSLELLDMVPYSISEVHTCVTETLFRMKSGMSDEYSSLVEEYIKANKEISTKLKYNIYPDDITRGFDAGWLAPTGSFYGLNGIVANMLHIEIADKLYSQGFIPHVEETDHLDSNGKDSWLEKHGWIRIHHDEVAFWPAPAGDPRKPTQAQIKKLVEYARACYGGNLTLISMSHAPLKASVLEQADDLQLRRMFDPYF